MSKLLAKIDSFFFPLWRRLLNRPRWFSRLKMKSRLIGPAGINPTYGLISSGQTGLLTPSCFDSSLLTRSAVTCWERVMTDCKVAPDASVQSYVSMSCCKNVSLFCKRTKGKNNYDFNHIWRSFVGKQKHTSLLLHFYTNKCFLDLLNRVHFLKNFNFLFD